MDERLETRGPKDCSLCNLICNNSFKNFVASKRVNKKVRNGCELTVTEILECQWVTNYLMGFLTKLVKLSRVMEYWTGFWNTKWGCNGVGEKPVGLLQHLGIHVHLDCFRQHL